MKKKARKNNPSIRPESTTPMNEAVVVGDERSPVVSFPVVGIGASAGGLEAVAQCNIRDISNRSRLEKQMQQQARAMIERQMRQLQRLVDDLLEVSRVTTGRVQLRKERVVVSRIVEGAVETVRPLIEQRHHELTVSLPPEPILLNADVARLEQVVANLLTNARSIGTVATNLGDRLGLLVQRSLMTPHSKSGSMALSGHEGRKKNEPEQTSEVSKTSSLGNFGSLQRRITSLGLQRYDAHGDEARVDLKSASLDCEMLFRMTH